MAFFLLSSAAPRLSGHQAQAQDDLKARAVKSPPDDGDTLAGSWYELHVPDSWVCLAPVLMLMPTGDLAHCRTLRGFVVCHLGSGL
jgi:hypothetical protein